MAKQKILSVEDISKRLKDRRLHVVAKATNLSFPTLKKLFDGNSRNYKTETLVRVSKYLLEN